MQRSLWAKKKKLTEAIQRFGRLAVALSGGVDSAVLLAEAKACLGNEVIALTARSPIHPEQELADATKIADQLGAPHFIVDTHETEKTDFLANTDRRCYICKKLIFAQLKALAAEKGFALLAHGANADDLGDYRPGLQAAREMGIAAPLIDAGWCKEDIRRVARERGLFVWNKPPMACFATRFPYGTPINLERVGQIKRAEQVLADAGISGCRVRHHDRVARIEAPLDRLPALTDNPLRQRIVDQLRAIGFLHVCVDLEGYVSGSLNRGLKTGAGRTGIESDAD